MDECMYIPIFAPKGTTLLYCGNKGDIKCIWTREEENSCHKYQQLDQYDTKYIGDISYRDNYEIRRYEGIRDGNKHIWTRTIHITMDEITIEEWNRNGDDKTVKYEFTR